MRNEHERRKPIGRALARAHASIEDRVGAPCDIALVLGSGLGHLADAVKNAATDPLCRDRRLSGLDGAGPQGPTGHRRSVRPPHRGHAGPAPPLRRLEAARHRARRLSAEAARRGHLRRHQRLWRAERRLCRRRRHADRGSSELHRHEPADRPQRRRDRPALSRPVAALRSRPARSWRSRRPQRRARRSGEASIAASTGPNWRPRRSGASSARPAATRSACRPSSR